MPGWHTISHRILDYCSAAYSTHQHNKRYGLHLELRFNTVQKGAKYGYIFIFLLLTRDITFIVMSRLASLRSPCSKHRSLQQGFSDRSSESTSNTPHHGCLRNTFFTKEEAREKKILKESQEWSKFGEFRRPQFPSMFKMACTQKFPCFKMACTQNLHLPSLNGRTSGLGWFL